MARRKNLDLEDFMAARVGLALSNYRWAPYAIFPIFEWGKVVYYQGRTMIDMPGEPTKLFPSRSEYPRGSRYWIYGVDDLRALGGRVVVVESILNKLSLDKELARRGITEFVVVACFKHKLSSEQLVKLQRIRNILEIVLLYDADATDAANAEALRIRPKFPLVTVAKMPKGDANDNAPLAVNQILLRAKPNPLPIDI